MKKNYDVKFVKFVFLIQYLFAFLIDVGVLLKLSFS